MRHEFHAEYNLQARYRHVQQAAIDFLTGNAVHPPTEWAELKDVRDMDARRLLLAQTQAPPAPYKDYARVGTRREAGGLLQAIRSGAWQRHLQECRKQMQQLGLLDTRLDPGMFPLFSFVVWFTFRLDSPYVSRDDAAWDVWDNPIKREWIFKVPYVASSQWKGALRAAMRQERGYTSLKQEQSDEQMVRLFGNIKEEEEHTMLQAGCLHFYPTFFDRIGLEVINPHDRGTGAGRQPIYFECVPAGTDGTFTLLYVPLEGAGEQDALADLETVARSVRAMLTRYGFGAKTSSGYGVAEIGKGQFQIAMEDPKSPVRPETEAAQPEGQTTSKAVEVFVRRLGLSEFPRWTNEELRASGWGKKRQSEYKRLRRQHPNWDESTHTWRMEGTQEMPPAGAETPRTSFVTREFDGGEDMEQEIDRLCQAVAGGGRDE